MNLRLMKPRLRPPAPTALVITRAWYWPETAMRPPLAELSTFTGPYFERNARSSSKLTGEGDAGGGVGGGVLMAGLAVGVAAGMALDVGAGGPTAGCWQDATICAVLNSVARTSHPLLMPRRLGDQVRRCQANVGGRQLEVVPVAVGSNVREA